MNRFAPAILAMALSYTAPNTSASAPLEDDVRPDVAVAPADSGVPIHTLIRAVAKKTGKKFLIDPRVDGKVQLIGEEASNVSYSELFTILQVLGFTAVEGGGFLRVIPATDVRASALPLVIGSANYPDAQYVVAVFPVRNVPAAILVPILRPLMPQQAHLAVAICSNAILMADTFANIQRIEALIIALDIGDPYKAERCEKAFAHA